MCGLFGLFHPHDQPVSTTVLTSATNSMRHRGPDDEGYALINTAARTARGYSGSDTDPRVRLPRLWTIAKSDANLSFGFRRLSILDLSDAGHQPMAADGGKAWIVFNGEVYNYVELRAELEQPDFGWRGYRFKSQTDTEVVLAAYLRWGSRCVERFMGMFAFAIYDGERNVLFLARDPFGIKPLHYTTAGGAFAFASEVTALLALPFVSRRADRRQLGDYLKHGQHDHCPESFFADIKRLMPRQHLTLPLSNDRPPSPRIEEYWRPDRKRSIRIGFQEAAEEVRSLFDQSVRWHLRSDVPVGCALSGGIDSSSIACTMRSQAPELDLHAFSFIAADPALSEENWIDLIGRDCHATVHKTRPNGAMLIEDLNKLIQCQGEPFASTSIYAQFCVFRLAKEVGVPVTLDGQGADEILAGYKPYEYRLRSIAANRELWRSLRFLGAMVRDQNGSYWKLLHDVPRRATKYAISRVAPIGVINHIRSLRSHQRDYRDGVIDVDYFSSMPPSQSPNGSYTEGPDYLRGVLWETLLSTCLPALLRYEDRNSMAFSIESRVPFVIRPLIEFVLSLPEAYLVDDTCLSKAVFRKAMRGRVADAVLDRRDKIGFATPEMSWLREVAPWVASLLSSETARRVPAISAERAAIVWNQVLAGRLPYTSRIWRWVNLIAWAEAFDVVFDDGHVIRRRQVDTDDTPQFAEPVAL